MDMVSRYENIPYGQSSAKLPVTRSLGHTVIQSIFSTLILTDELTHNIRTYRSASQTNTDWHKNIGPNDIK